MRRREFITLVGGAVAAWPLAGRAQQPVMPRMGVLLGYPEGVPEGESWRQALVEGLSKFGWNRDNNIRIDVRWGAEDPNRMQKLAKELVEMRPDCIQVSSTPATAAVLRETHTIPVVFLVSDPIGSGFISNLAQPGGNATGLILLEDSVAGKWLELLKALNLSSLNPVQSENRAAVRLLPKITGSCCTINRARTEGPAGQQHR